MPFWSAKGHLLECERRPSAFDTMNKFYIICVPLQFKHYLLDVDSVYNYHLLLGFSCHCFPSVGALLHHLLRYSFPSIESQSLICWTTVFHQLDINLFICSVTVSYLLIHCFSSVTSWFPINGITVSPSIELLLDSSRGVVSAYVYACSSQVRF